MSYGLTIFFAKLSLFLLYLRLFSPDRWMRVAIYVGIVTNLLVYMAISVAFGIMCLPRHGETWQTAPLSARCSRAPVLGYVNGTFNVLSDFYLLALPIPVIWHLQMPRKKKYSVFAVFLTGLM